ncbi:MAG: TAXI family TRAP transporter solute-binding subunit [Alphaproteobacteria bacterium]|nr:TAXI family TRAP transporter solute-binding subunit [Alphaproteobacteria bacterium]MDX5370072.1 TAXI family TRAP transporter solute-binding subunit [Alphaproteobacteria bacterium]MDX5464645.1 TAXI family TRAP transporter solute-binding subunit [Alphaproteobacteria bacterium]
MTSQIFKPSRRDALLLGLGTAVASTGLLRATTSLAQQSFQWGSSSIGSTGYVIMEGLASTVNRHTDLQNASMATSGGTENMQLFHEGVIQFGQTTSTDWLPASRGEAPYPQPITVHQMFAYTLFNCTPMVRADSDIQTLDDLKGRRCMPSPAGSSTATMWRVLFEAAGIKDEVEWTYGSWRESYDALRGGAVDCIPSLLTNGRASPIMSELATTVPVRILPIPDEVMKKARALNPGISRGIIPAGAAGIAEETGAASFSGVLGASPNVSEEHAYQVIKAVFDNAEEVRNLGVQFKDIAIDFAAEYLVAGFPIHKGAARYFKEKGVWRDDMVEG